MDIPDLVRALGCEYPDAKDSPGGQFLQDILDSADSALSDGYNAWDLADGEVAGRSTHEIFQVYTDLCLYSWDSDIPAGDDSCHGTRGEVIRGMVEGELFRFTERAFTLIWEEAR